MSNNTFNTIYHKGEKWNSLINVNVTGLKVSTLWEGSKTSSGSITLNESMNNYDYLRFFGGTPKGSNGSTTIPIRLFKTGYASLINRNWWGASHDEYINFNYVDDTHINVGIATTYNLSAFLVEGIRVGSIEAGSPLDTNGWVQISNVEFYYRVKNNVMYITARSISSSVATSWTIPEQYRPKVGIGFVAWDFANNKKLAGGIANNGTQLAFYDLTSGSSNMGFSLSYPLD